MARGQAGHVTAKQAAAKGIVATALAKAVKRGTLDRISHGLYRLPSVATDDPRTRLWRAILELQVPRATISHETALAAHGVHEQDRDAAVHVTVPAAYRARRKHSDWISVHRAELDTGEIAMLDGLPVTTVSRSLRDSALQLDSEVFSRALSEARLRGFEASESPEPAISMSNEVAVVSQTDGVNAHPIFTKEQLPPDWGSIPELDVSDELTSLRAPSPWFVLGEYLRDDRRDGFERIRQRQTVLVSVRSFQQLFDSLNYVGNVFSDLGQSSGVVSYYQSNKDYSYTPFHEFEFRGTATDGEPMCFLRETSTALELSINPDIIFYLGLEERVRGSGTWTDPRTGAEVILHVEARPKTSVRIRTEYLLRYLRARQRCLLVGVFERCLYRNPDREAVAAFEASELTMGSAEGGAKALVFSTGPQKMLSLDPFIRRELHLWFQLEPPALDVDHAFDDPPTFDVCSLTFPTRSGLVAPARFRAHGIESGRPLAGGTCDFMDRIYFRQDVLSRYEGTDGFTVDDDGSVTCGHYWSLSRSTQRIGNDLLCTAIGDFAEGVPFEEWPHWKLYSVDPPSHPYVKAIASETTVIEAVNGVLNSLERFASVFSRFATALSTTPDDTVWNGSEHGLAGRQLKRFYPPNASEDEFLKRATLASTLVIEGLNARALRQVAREIGPDFHLGGDGRPLGSRRLLERITLAACIIESMQPKANAVAELAFLAEGRGKGDAEIEDELSRIRDSVRSGMAPLAFLYDLRIHGGVAHAPNIAEARTAAENLGLSTERWSRPEFVSMLRRVEDSVRYVSRALFYAGNAIGVS